MNQLIKFFIICILGSLPSRSLSLLGYGSSSSEEDSSSSSIEEEYDEVKVTKSCPAVSLRGIDWILNVRQPDYGWKENTHRAVIALAINEWGNTGSNERKLMEQQLEVEITKALLRNSSSPIYPNNLALYIQALIATNKNPRDFHNIDLVEHLLKFVHVSGYNVHPFLLLVLCNAKSLTQSHLRILEYSLANLKNKNQNIEYKALALQAYECAGTIDFKINQTLVLETQKYLINQQYPDGSFGNVYTTAMIVQALSGSSLTWNKAEAISYLRKQSLVEVNMVSTYLIELALNADKVRFIKDLHPNLPMNPALIEIPTKKYFIQYSLKVGPNPDVRHTITINVPPESNFFEIMKICAKVDPKFNFSYYMDKKKEPSVYAISNIPNDAEENFYWRICLQSGIEHQNHTSQTTTIRTSPIHLHPKQDEHVIYWYNDKDCEDR